MTTVDWKKVLIRSSCAGKIMTEGKGTVLTDKQAEEIERLQGLPKITVKQSETLSSLILKRDAPPALSDTCTSYLREVYQYHKYGKESTGGAQRSKYTIKGNAVEPESIMLISRFYGVEFEKNTERKNNTHLTGEMDVRWKEKRKTIDVKSVWDMESLLTHVPNPDKPNEKLYDPLYWWQGQCYMNLDDADTHDLCYCLVNMPAEFMDWEREKIRRILNPVTDENIEFKEAVAKMEFNYEFDEIPYEERIVKFEFERDEEAIKKLYARVDECRIWLEKFEKIHTTLNNVN